MEKIFDEIDKVLIAAFNDKGLKNYGLCELISKDGKPNPVQVKADRKPAQIHDRYPGIYYHRLLSGQFTEDEDNTFGKVMKKRFTGRARTVVAYKVNLSEEFMFQFADAFPDRIATLTEYKFVHLSQGTIIADHEGVFNQEYGNQSYEKHRTPWNIFALEYDIEFILC